MELTGERFIPIEMGDPAMVYEHLHRYFIASEYVKDKNVLDIACGTGYGSRFLADYAKKVTGIDIAKESIDYAQRNFSHPNITYKLGSVAEILLPDHSIDVIVSCETIEHVDEQIQTDALKEFKRVLKPDGILIISTPSKDSREYDINNEYHIKEFYTDEFVNFLKNQFKYVTYAGQDVRVTSSVFYEDNAETGIYYSSFPMINNTDFPQKHMAKYIIAICSDKKEVHIKNSILVDNENKMIKNLKNNKIVLLVEKFKTFTNYENSKIAKLFVKSTFSVLKKFFKNL
jgi:O-antigen biosynthesis protein